jgi:hypothetical protein
VGKRVVFIHPDGVHEICGVVDQYPITLGPFPTRGRLVAFASVIRVTARAVFYKEPMIPASYTFDAAQR